MTFEKAAESQIQEGMAAGLFDNLPGSGKPLALGDGENLAGANWLGFRVLRNAGMLPEWLNLAREIERDCERLDRLDAEHAALCQAAARSGDWHAYRLPIARVRDRYEALARTLRRRQDRFNYDAPGIRSERPAIWVEYHLERLDRRMREAGAPGDGTADSARGHRVLW
ncbi:MAG TPA: DUF1992 domain-containing protein [Tepidiformaceae bacterium]|nr:DUF1992 domain-containing protein [Tepidiformaceae bacterium]